MAAVLLIDKVALAVTVVPLGKTVTVLPKLNSLSYSISVLGKLLLRLLIMFNVLMLLND